MSGAGLRDLLDDLDRLGVLDHVIGARLDGTFGVSVTLDTCAAYRTVLSAYKARDDGGRLLGSLHQTPHCVMDADCGTFVAKHVCFPWLDCWDTSPSRRIA